LIRKQGVEHFKKLIDEAQDFLDFQINRKKASNGGDMRNQVMLAEQTAATIAMNPSPAARDLMIRAHSVQLGVTEDAMRRLVNSYVKRQQKSAAAREGAMANAEPKEITVAQAATRLLTNQHKTALLFAHTALASAEIMEWLRTQDFDAILHDLPGTEILGLVWHTHFDPADSAARAGWISSLHPVEESAISQLMTRALPGNFKEIKEDGSHIKEQIDSLSQDLYNLGTTRVHHLIQRSQAELKQQGLSPERISLLSERVMVLRKEYLDRNRPR
jgi:DNA primase